VKDVSSSRRNFYLNHFGSAVLENFFNFDSHLGSTGFDLVSVELESKNSVDVGDLDIEVVIGHGRGEFFAHVGSVLVSDLDLLAFVLPFSSRVSRELSSKNGEADLGLPEIGGGNLNKDILSIACDLSSIRVDKRRERKDVSVSIEKDRELIVAFQNRQEFLHNIIIFVFNTKVGSGHAFSLLESLELNVSGRHGLVGDGTLNLVQVVSSHRSELTSAADVLMELVLEVDEGVVRGQGEVHITEDASNNVRTYASSLSFDNDLLERVLNFSDLVAGKSILLSKVATECSSDSFETE